MNTEKIIVCNADEAQNKIQPLLDQSWKIKSMVAENVSISISMGQDSWGERERMGKIIFILQNDEK